MAKETLDLLDRKIMYQLDFNARASNSEIAKKLKTGRETVGYRIKKLMRMGVITGFYAIIDTAKLGFRSCRFLMKFKNAPREKEEEIISYFLKDKKYWWVDSIEGLYSLGVACWLQDLDDFYSERIKFMEKFGAYVKTLDQSMYVNFHIFRRAYLANKRVNDSPPVKISKVRRYKLDKKDMELLKVISGDARAPIVEIAKKLRWSVGSVVHRLKMLEKEKVILAYRPLIDLSKINRYWYKVNFTLKDYSKLKSMIAYFNSHPDIVYAYEMIGGADLEVELEVESYEHFMEVVRSIRSKFEDSIESYEHYLWYKEHKLTFLPEFSPH